VYRCDNSSSECKSEEEYQLFISDLFIGSSIYQLQMDFNNFRGEPVFKQLQKSAQYMPVTSLNNQSFVVDMFIKQN
jgi:hypothetical protein